MNIDCLLQNCTKVDVDERSFELNIEVVGKIVPFLQCFPKLECAIIGAPLLPDTPDLWYYSVSECRGPADHESIFKSLIYSLGGAFASKALRQSICLEGIIGRFKKYHCDPTSCVHCRYILRTFPLSTIVCCFGTINGYERSDFCVPDEEVCEIIQRRIWTDECIKTADKEVLSHKFSNLFHCFDVHISDLDNMCKSANGIDKRLQERVKKEWKPSDQIFMRYFSERKLRRLELLRDIGEREKVLE